MLSFSGQKQMRRATYAAFTALFVSLHTCLTVLRLPVSLLYLRVGLSGSSETEALVGGYA